MTWAMIRLREPIRVWFTNKFDQMPIERLLEGAEMMAAHGARASASASASY